MALMGKKLKLKGKSKRFPKSEVDRLKELHAFFESAPGKVALVYFRQYCRIGMEAPKDPALHSFTLGMSEPYTRLVNDIRLGYLARDGQLTTLDPMEEDVYGGTNTESEPDPIPGSIWGLNS